MLADGTKQAGPIGSSDIYWSKSHLKIILFQVEFLGAYVHVLLFSFGDILLSCCCDATMFVANRWPLPHEYSQIGPIFIFKKLHLFYY